MTTLSEAEYEKRAVPELKALIDAVDAVEGDGFDAELESDILTIEFQDGARYVINSHRAARQIWMAAERSAWHFDWNDDRKAWIAAKSGDELWETLGRVLGNKLGSKLVLSRVS